MTMGLQAGQVHNPTFLLTKIYKNNSKGMLGRLLT